MGAGRCQQLVLPLRLPAGQPSPLLLPVPPQAHPGGPPLHRPRIQRDPGAGVRAGPWQCVCAVHSVCSLCCAACCASTARATDLMPPAAPPAPAPFARPSTSAGHGRRRLLRQCRHRAQLGQCPLHDLGRPLHRRWCVQRCWARCRAAATWWPLTSRLYEPPAALMCPLLASSSARRREGGRHGAAVGASGLQQGRERAPPHFPDQQPLHPGPGL